MTMRMVDGVSVELNDPRLVAHDRYQIASFDTHDFRPTATGCAGCPSQEDACISDPSHQWHSHDEDEERCDVCGECIAR